MFGFLSSFHDVLSFALTCADVWACGIRSLERAWAKRFAPWSGAALVCLGSKSQNLPHTYSDSNTLASLAARIGQSAEEVDVWQNMPSGSAGASLRNQVADDEEDAYDEEDSWRRQRLGDLMKVLRERLDENTVYADHSADRDLASSARHMREGGVWTRLLSLTDATTGSSGAVRTASPGTTLSTQNYPRPVFLLRNLTKQCFVRSDTLGGEDADPALGLGSALISKICWSSDPETDLRTNPLPGAWAGDGFDVVSLEDIERESGEGMKGWSDATEEVRALLVKIWRDWEETWGNETDGSEK